MTVVAAGTMINTVTVTADTLTSDPATATITTGGVYLVRYAANLAAGESYIDIVNTGAYGAPLLGPGFGSNTGNICVNVYAVDPGEELDACCSCLVTPDQAVYLGANADLMVNAAYASKPSSIAIKLIASIPSPDSTCTNSASTVSAANLANGAIVAWGTTLHPAPGSITAYVTTEAPFAPATLSASELTSLTARCSNIIGNMSGSGICASCHAGALGASKK